ncbi:hypothetical protein K458DRAFT_422074 [Lentithecium fluviatile CBS 122367]|uniref:Uncharacterized protein n=1 Tax=Lentithecium fluviatile CBS 122367 TaxID=1168545 RepID=A0A6G1IP65_9PLEO|nr:hypothetical protein K458DRAFT_422074 [Lentithecium fluviatile CBS 122367]
MCPPRRPRFSPLRFFQRGADAQTEYPADGCKPSHHLLRPRIGNRLFEVSLFDRVQLNLVVSTAFNDNGVRWAQLAFALALSHSHLPKHLNHVFIYLFFHSDNCKRLSRNLLNMNKFATLSHGYICCLLQTRLRCASNIGTSRTGLPRAEMRTGLAQACCYLPCDPVQRSLCNLN